VRWSLARGGGGSCNCTETQDHRKGLEGGGGRRWRRDLDTWVAIEVVARRTWRWGGHRRLQSESEVGRKPSFATIGGVAAVQQTRWRHPLAAVAWQWDILGWGGGGDLEGSSAVT
jgi:hypothetical protein